MEQRKRGLIHRHTVLSGPQHLRGWPLVAKEEGSALTEEGFVEESIEQLSSCYCGMIAYGDNRIIATCQICGVGLCQTCLHRCQNCQQTICVQHTFQLGSRILCRPCGWDEFLGLVIGITLLLGLIALAVWLWG
jgi:hypothetical protein